MKQEKNIDKLFKHGLEDPVDETRFREDDWDAFEQLLDKGKTSGRVYWLSILSSVAAILLAVFGWWLFRPQATDHAQKAQQQLAINDTQKVQPAVIVNPANKTQIASKANNSTTQTQQTAALHQPQQNSNTMQPVTTNAPGKMVKQLPQQTNERSQYIANNVGVGSNNKTGNTSLGEPVNGSNASQAIITNQTIVGQTSIYNADDRKILTAYNTVPGITTINSIGTPVITAGSLFKPTINGTAPGAKIAIKKTGVGLRPQYALTVLASTEQNGVGSLQKTNSGTNIGLLFSVGVKRLSLTTGASYSIKPYTLPFDQYHTTYTFKNQPEYVSADCRVLDIPINLDYQVYKTSRNKISLGTGVSSYIMMHESYTYDYGNSGSVYGPSYYAVKGKGKYLFSIMNLQATYQRQVNSKVGISLQPYLKVPLSNIGYSQVKIETFGVAVGLSWNINSLTKPK